MDCCDCEQNEDPSLPLVCPHCDQWPQESPRKMCVTKFVKSDPKEHLSIDIDISLISESICNVNYFFIFSSLFFFIKNDLILFFQNYIFESGTK